MAAGYLLGIDVGTSGVRAAAFEPSGAKVADAAVACSYEVPARGWAEARAEGWWTAVLAALSALETRMPGRSLASVAAIGVVGQAPTAVLVDEAGAPLAPAILWLDTRANEEARDLGVHAYYLGPKLLWMSRSGRRARGVEGARAGDASAPDPVLERARWVLQSHAFITHRLTGEAAIDPSTAALSAPLFDLAARAWRPEACASVGVRLEQLPPIHPAHAVIGAVTRAAAAAIGHGLRPGTAVVAGGGDFAAATLGAGVLDEGEACLMLGTAGNLLVPRRAPGRDARLIHSHHVGADAWLSLGGTLSGGAQEWLRSALSRASAGELVAAERKAAAGGAEERAAMVGRAEGAPPARALPSFEQLDAEAERLPTGSDGLLFLPYLQGERTPIWDTLARGAYVGLGLSHGRGHLWRALLEGIALGFADCQEVLAQEGVRLREVVAANGGGKSALFRQILADALGVPLAYAPAAGGTVSGAAILAGLGTGALRSATEARSWQGPLVHHAPTPAAHARYRELLALRREAYAGLRPVFAGLASLG